MAAEIFIYLDDRRRIAPTKTICWEASRSWGSTCSWLGRQDASRKIEPPSQALGPWDGTVRNTEGGVHGLVSLDIWDKTRRLLEELVGMEQEEREGMPRDIKESITGLLVYISSTYRYINPYLKGVHLTQG